MRHKTKSKRFTDKKRHHKKTSKQSFRTLTATNPQAIKNKATHEAASAMLLELEFLPGLEVFVRQELREQGIHDVQMHHGESVRFRYPGNLKKLFGLRRAVALYSVLEFAIPRPKALLGDEHLRRLLKSIDELRAFQPFHSFRFSAAGSDSPVFQKLAETLVQGLRLPYDAEAGELLLVVRPSILKPSTKGWEVALRLTPRPLSARAWRVCNLEGGLNATLAVIMNDVAKVQPHERYLSAMCGSGTLLIEQALTGQPVRLLGCDLSPRALACARENIVAAGLETLLPLLLEADVTRLPLSENSFDVVTANLPWGDAVGSHRENDQLYPAFLDEMARVTTPQARLVLLTHDIKLFEKHLAVSAWQPQENYRVFHGGHYPRLYVLKKS
ncbi:MAG: methyltransferase domain-containing protein [Trueperaceae bacterium]